MIKNSKTRVVAYVRVSTDQQANEGVSLEAQEAKIRQYEELYDLDVVAIEIDAGESAATLERPGMQRALRRLDRFEAEALLVVKLDRLTRSVRDLCDLVDTYFKDGEHSLISIGEQLDTRSAAGRMMLTMLVTIGQWEREVIGERTSAAMQHLKSQGRYCGGRVPYGKAKDGDMLIDEPTEIAVVEQARALRVVGHTLRTIANLLPPARNGKSFTAQQILRML